jgi:hypothetical protein
MCCEMYRKPFGFPDRFVDHFKHRNIVDVGLGSISTFMIVGPALPVYPHKQTSSESGGMSQTCQNRL